MSTLKYLSADPNLQTFTLGSDYTAADGHMHLTAGHGARLPSGGDFWIRTPVTGDPTNVFKVTARSTDEITVTCVTGYGADQNWATDTEFAWGLTGEALDQLRTDLNREMTVSAFDALAAGEYRDGDRILLTDSIYEVCRIGGAWSYRYGTQKVTRPPSADWSWDNQGTATIDSTNGYEYLEVPKKDATACAWRYRTAPSTPYVVTAGIIIDIAALTLGSTATIATVGPQIIFRESSTGKVVEFRYNHSGSDNAEAHFAKWNSSTSFNSAYTSIGPAVHLNPGPRPSVLWMRIEDDGTYLKVYHSLDKCHWKQFGSSQSRTDFLTGGPDQIGWGAYANQCPAVVALIHWAIS